MEFGPYITATRRTHTTPEHKKAMMGPCGPCAAIELFGLSRPDEFETDYDFELHLKENGRAKPLWCANSMSFAFWASQFDRRVVIYTDMLAVSLRAVEVGQRYEGFKKEKIHDYLREANAGQAQLRRQFGEHILPLKERPVDTLDTLLDMGMRVAHTITATLGEIVGDDSIPGAQEEIAHWRVCVGKVDASGQPIDESNEPIPGASFVYHDSNLGRLLIPREVAEEHMAANEGSGFGMEFVAYLPSDQE